MDRSALCRLPRAVGGSELEKAFMFGIMKTMPRFMQASLIAASAVFVIVVWSGCSQPEPVPQQAGAVQVVVATPVKKTIVEWDEYVGRFDAVDFVEVRARVSGYLQSIHFEEGQIVKEGDLLCVIDPKPFVA